MAEIQTYDLRFTSPTLYQLSYKVKPGAGSKVVIFVFDILKLFYSM